MTSASAGAVISDDQLYRYRLWRGWDVDSPRVVWIMLNPSTGDGIDDDPTINRCLSFSRRAGMGRLEIVNLYALRSPDPDLLLSHPAPTGPDNERHIREVLAGAAMVVCAWGSHPGALRSPVRLKLAMMVPDGVQVVCLGYAGKHQPRHPGRIAAVSAFEPFVLP